MVAASAPSSGYFSPQAVSSKLAVKENAYSPVKPVTCASYAFRHARFIAVACLWLAFRIKRRWQRRNFGFQSSGGMFYTKGSAPPEIKQKCRWSVAGKKSCFQFALRFSPCAKFAVKWKKFCRRAAVGSHYHAMRAHGKFYRCSQRHVVVAWILLGCEAFQGKVLEVAVKACRCMACSAMLPKAKRRKRLAQFCRSMILDFHLPG